MPAPIRGSRAKRHRWRAQGMSRFLAALCVYFPAPAGAAEQPALALHELVLSAQSSIDQHQITFIAVVCGVVLFAVVTAIMLVRTWARAARHEGRLRNEIAALREEVDRANALMRSEPQVVVVWPAGSDEPKIDGDPGAVGVSMVHQVLAFGSWLDAGKASAVEHAVEALRARGEAFAMTLTTRSGHP